MGESGRIRVLLADSQSLFREAVRHALGVVPELSVVAVAGDGMQAVSEAETYRPDVAVLADGLPEGGGIRAAGLLRERVPRCRIVLLAADLNPEVLVEGFNAGIRGYVSKSLGLADLVGAIVAVHEERTVVPPSLLGDLIDRLIGQRWEADEAMHLLSRLTARERAVLRLLAEGGSNETIARELAISRQTARTHVQNILGKLGLHSRLAAAAFVMRNGRLDLLKAAES
jgi:two-component system nitrate/nitrite response regulator NarL